MEGKIPKRRGRDRESRMKDLSEDESSGDSDSSASNEEKGQRYGSQGVTSETKAKESKSVDEAKKATEHSRYKSSVKHGNIEKIKTKYSSSASSSSSSDDSKIAYKSRDKKKSSAHRNKEKEGTSDKYKVSTGDTKKKYCKFGSESYDDSKLARKSTSKKTSVEKNKEREKISDEHKVFSEGSKKKHYTSSSSSGSESGDNSKLARKSRDEKKASLDKNMAKKITVVEQQVSSEYPKTKIISLIDSGSESIENSYQIKELKQNADLKEKKIKEGAPQPAPKNVVHIPSCKISIERGYTETPECISKQQKKTTDIKAQDIPHLLKDDASKTKDVEENTPSVENDSKQQTVQCEKDVPEKVESSKTLIDKTKVPDKVPDSGLSVAEKIFHEKNSKSVRDSSSSYSSSDSERSKDKKKVKKDDKSKEKKKPKRFTRITTKRSNYKDSQKYGKRDRKRDSSASSTSSSSSSKSRSRSSISTSSSSSSSSSKSSSKSPISKRRSSSSSSSTSSSSPRRHRYSFKQKDSKHHSRSPLKIRKKSQPPRPSKVHVGHLTKNINKDHLFEIFNFFGPVKSVDLPMNRAKGPFHRGFAYVEYDSPEYAEKAIQSMNGGIVDGQKIKVEPVLPFKPRTSVPMRRISTNRRPFGNRRYSPPFRNRGTFMGSGGRDRRRPIRSPPRRSGRRTRSRSPIRRRRMRHTSRSSSR